MARISVSIPDDLLRALDKLAREEGVSRSELVAIAVRSYLLRRGLLPGGEKEYPTALWKLKVTGALRLRSPRRVGRRLHGEWIIEA